MAKGVAASATAEPRQMSMMAGSSMIKAYHATCPSLSYRLASNTANHARRRDLDGANSDARLDGLCFSGVSSRLFMSSKLSSLLLATNVSVVKTVVLVVRNAPG